MVLLRLCTLITATIMIACSSAAPPHASAADEPVQVKPTTRAAKPALPQGAEPTVFAKSAILVDAITGRILFQKNAYEQRAVASTQKLLTALVVYRAGPLDTPVVVEKSDTLVEPSKLYIRVGETYTRRELVKALLVKSGNDVALALARSVSGSKEAFAARMNATAASLGMRNSHFRNPHGLTEEGQYSTARDLAILAREVLQIPYFRQCMQIKSYTFKHPGGGSREIKNTNKVLRRLSYCTGMKTGTTIASGKCLVSSGTLNGRTVVVVALGSKNPQVWDDSVKLLKYGLE